MDYLRLSKEISYALRHHPEKYNLALDNQGYVNIENLLYALNATKHYSKEISIEDILEVIKLSNKKRLEITKDKIRALYGHSMKNRIIKDPSIPPDILYHGTSHNAVNKILVEGLKPMQRQYVHLSVDQETAILVGKRKEISPVLLLIDAKRALKDGVKFYIGNDKVWLSDFIPAQYIQRIES